MRTKATIMITSRVVRARQCICLQGVATHSVQLLKTKEKGHEGRTNDCHREEQVLQLDTVVVLVKQDDSCAHADTISQECG